MKLNIDRMRRHRQRTRTLRHEIVERSSDGGSIACKCGWYTLQESEQLAGVAWGGHLISIAGQGGAS